MYPRLFSCCKHATRTAPWIFVYTNGDAFSVCDEHFLSKAHRNRVKYVIDMKIPDRVFLPDEVFREVLREVLLEKMH